MKSNSDTLSLTGAVVGTLAGIGYREFRSGLLRESYTPLAQLAYMLRHRTDYTGPCPFPGKLLRCLSLLGVRVTPDGFMLNKAEAETYRVVRENMYDRVYPNRLAE